MADKVNAVETRRITAKPLLCHGIEHVHLRLEEKEGKCEWEWRLGSGKPG